MKGLKDLLGNPFEGLTKDEVQKKCAMIAKELFTNYHIEKLGEEYIFTELEFYYCSKNHPDLITYPRDMEEGRWFFHQSGIDLTFRSSYSRYNDSNGVVDMDKDFSFGGILIRGIKNVRTLETFDGPYKCEWELFDNFDAINIRPEEWPRLVENKETLKVTLDSSKRKFSYTKEKMKKKYEELTQTVYIGKYPVTFEEFCEYIKQENLAYKIKI